MFTTLYGFSSENKQKNDTLNKYGLRAGLDIQKIIRSASDKDYKGLSINADIRIKKQLYISAEIGNEEKNTNHEYIRSTSKGNYICVKAKMFYLLLMKFKRVLEGQVKCFVVIIMVLSQTF